MSGRRRAAGLVLAVVLLAIGVRALTMYGFSSAGAAAYFDGDHARSERLFTSSGVLNPVQPWRAHLGVGLARYRQGDLVGAEETFTRALDDAPERCDLRFDLAVTIEAQGDRLVAGEPLDVDDSGQLFDTQDVSRPPPVDPFERYTFALAVIDARACESHQAGDAAARLAEARVRILAKLEALETDERVQNSDRNEVDESADNERGDGEQIEELETRNDAGAAQREAGRDLDATGGTPEGQSNW